jgi:hypothetical protein
MAHDSPNPDHGHPAQATLSVARPLGCPFRSGEPAPERITDKIYGETQTISVLHMADIPDVDLSKVRASELSLAVFALAVSA